MNDISERLQACYTGVVHDVMRAMGLRDFTLPAELRPILPEQAMAGPAFTIEGMVVPGVEAHETLLAWTGLLSKAPAGSIWVSQPNDRVVAHMGELSAETLKNKGVKGCIADGFIRDVNFLLAIGFQAWCRGFTPRDIVGHWLPKATEVPITHRRRSDRAWRLYGRRPRRADPGAARRSRQRSWRRPRPRWRPKASSARQSWRAPTRRRPISNTESSEATTSCDGWLD